MRTCEVELTVSLRVNGEVVADPAALRKLRGDLTDLIIDAAMGAVGDPERPLCRYTPPDDLSENGLRVTVGSPRVELTEALTHPQVVTAPEPRPLHTRSDDDVGT